MTHLPEGYARATVRGDLVVARADVLDRVAGAVEEAGSLYAFARTQPGAQPLEGRGTAYRVAVAEGCWVVRHYRRGGALASRLGDRYLRTAVPRPVRELIASEAVRRRGVLTPQVVAATVHTSAAFQRGDIATEFVPDSADLAAVSLGPGRWSEAERVAAWAAAGQLIRETARAGVVHADLNLKNILIAGAQPAPHAWLIDLDRCRITDPPSPIAPDRMVARLHRSREKLERRTGDAIGRTELDAFREALRA